MSLLSDLLKFRFRLYLIKTRKLTRPSFLLLSFSTVHHIDVGVGCHYAADVFYACIESTRLFTCHSIVIVNGCVYHAFIPLADRPTDRLTYWLHHTSTLMLMLLNAGQVATALHLIKDRSWANNRRNYSKQTCNVSTDVFRLPSSDRTWRRHVRPSAVQHCFAMRADEVITNPGKRRPYFELCQTSEVSDSCDLNWRFSCESQASIYSRASFAVWTIGRCARRQSISSKVDDSDVFFCCQNF